MFSGVIEKQHRAVMGQAIAGEYSYSVPLKTLEKQRFSDIIRE